MHVQVLVTEFAPLGSLHDVLETMADEGRQAGDAVLLRIAMQVRASLACLAVRVITAMAGVRGYGTGRKRESI